MSKRLNIYDLIVRENHSRLDNIAVVHRSRQIGYGGLFYRVEVTARFLEKKGVSKNSRVALRCPDSDIYVIWALALLKIEAAQVPVSFSSSDVETRKTCDRIEADFMISCVPAADKWEGEHEDFRFKFDDEEFVLRRLSAQIRERARNSSSFPDSAAFIRFTSGTTSDSKGVAISHEAVIARTDSANEGLKITENDKVLWVLSMAYHFVVTILLFLRRGATIVICEEPATFTLPQVLALNEITFLYASPFYYNLMVGSGEISSEMLSRVRLAVSTATPMDHTLARKFLEKFGFRPRQAYGIIEVGLPCVDLGDGPFVPGLVGGVLPPCELRIEGADDNGNGCVMLRSPGMFDGYLSPVLAKNEVCDDGFFNTGDIGRLDDLNRLVLVGRKKNVINFAGMKLFPYEIESVIRTCPLVEDVVVQSERDDTYGEIPKALIVLKPDMRDSADVLHDIRAFCYRNLATHEVPKRFELKDELPHTPSGKVVRH